MKTKRYENILMNIAEYLWDREGCWEGNSSQVKSCGSIICGKERGSKCWFKRLLEVEGKL